MKTAYNGSAVHFV